MKIRNLLHPLVFTLSALVLTFSAAYAQPCEPIRFERGHYSGTVQGVAPPDDVVCYEVSAGSGQRANVRVKGRNVMFSIPGVAEAQDRSSFTTEKKTYRILVVQLMRSVSDEPFSLTVSVR